MTNTENAPTFPRNHDHCMDRTGINYVPCTSLTHCPSICDCPIDACTASAPDYSQPQPDCDYTIQTITETGLTVGTCLACGTETAWQRSATKAQAQMVEHVQREWMSH